MALAVKYLKSGIESFVDDQARHLQRDLIDLVKKENPNLSKVYCTECTRVEYILPEHVVKKRECPHNTKRGRCNCKLSKKTRECPNRVCGILYDKIVMDHYCGNPNWKNTTPAKWTTDHWEVAKCFLQEGSDSYVDKKSACETDVEGLLSICINSLSIRKNIDGISKFQMVRQSCTGLTESNRVGDTNVYMELVENIIDVLSDKKAFATDIGAMEAVTSIRELKKSITSTAISPAGNENPQMKMDAIDADPNANISTNSDLIDDIHSTGILNNAQSLTFQNEWNVESYSTVKRASQSLKELILENNVPLCERSQTCSNDIIRLSHSEASNILTNFSELVKLRLRNVECIPDINCECERIPVNHIIPYVKMQSTHVTCSKTSNESGKSNTVLKGFELEINGTVFHNETLVEAENIEFAFPLKCKKLQALTKITICNMHLSHTQLGCIMCEIPSLQTVDLQNTICTVDTQCGCSNTKSGPIKGTSEIKEFSSAMSFNTVSSKRLKTGLGPSVFSPTILCHLEHAPNLTDMKFDGLHDITFLMHYLNLVPNPNRVCRLKLKNTKVDKDTLLGVIQGYKSGLHLTLENVLVNNPSEDINTQLLNGLKNMNIEQWEMTADIITYGKLNTKLCSEILLSPCSAWPAYDYTSKHVSHVESVCTALFETCGLHEFKAQEPLIKRLFRNVKIHVLTYSKTQRQYFDELFNDLKCKRMCSEDSDAVAVSQEKEEYDPVFLVATDKERLNVLKTCALDNITSENANYHIVFVKEIDHTVADAEQTVDKLSEDIPITYTTKANVFNDIDDLLEKYAFETVHKKARTMQYLCSVLKEKQWNIRHIAEYGLALTKDETSYQCLNDLNKNAVEIRETFSMIETVYERSCVPVPEWLSFPEVPDQHSKEEFIQGVLNLGLKNIIGHAESYGTIHFYLNVDLTNPEMKVLQNKIGETAQNCFNPSYILHYIHRDVKKLDKVGAKVGCITVGTLGGFAITNDNRVENDCVLLSGACSSEVSNDSIGSVPRNLYAILAKHVAKRQARGVLLCEGQIFANIKEPVDGQLDIAVALITKQNIPRCVTRFKDEYGNLKPCTLFEYQADVTKVVGNIVHLWGAYTSPGLGVICQSNYMESDMKPQLIIRSRGKGPFCVGGDSGSVVCAVDRRGNMYAIGMLVGEMHGPKEEGKYLAFRLHDGFRQLSELHGTDFKLPE